MRKPLNSQVDHPARKSFPTLLVVGGMLLALALGTFIAQPVRAPVQNRSAVTATAPTLLSADAHRRLLAEQSYLRAQLRWELRATTPEQAGVARYLRAHGANIPLPAATRPMTPDVRAVFDYLRAHGW